MSIRKAESVLFLLELNAILCKFCDICDFLQFLVNDSFRFFGVKPTEPVLEFYRTNINFYCIFCKLDRFLARLSKICDILRKFWLFWSGL